MSTMRIGGLASGMDIDSIVEKLMVAERMPMDKLEQQKQIYEWQRDAYRDVNKKMTTLDTYIADNFILKSLNTKTATSSNSDLVSAVATGSASGSLTIESVSQLAKAARGIGTPINQTSSTKLKELFNGPGETMPTNFTLSAINTQGKLGEEISIVIDENITLSEFITKINGSNAGVSALFENGQLSITAKNTGKAVEEDGVTLTDAMTTDTNGLKLFAKLGLNNLVTEEGQNAEFQVNGIATERTTNAFSINGYNITLKSTFKNKDTQDKLIKEAKETLTLATQSLKETINSLAKTYNVTLSGSPDNPTILKEQLDAVQKKIESKINEHRQNSEDTTKSPEERAAAENKRIEAESAANLLNTKDGEYNDSVAALTNLESTTTITANPVTMTSSTNVDEIMTKVKEFVATYNGFITDLTAQTKQPKYRDYQPLTELQKKEMEAKDIENWETRAKSGLLRNDSILTSGLSSLRGLVYQTNHAVTNQKYNALYTIGIGTSKDYNSGGTLEIDETKLRKALEEDPDAVVQLLTMSGEKSASITKADGSTGTGDTRGFMRKIRDEMDVIEKKIDERAGRGSMTETQYTLGKYLRNVNQSLDSWKDKLTKIEDRYWKQFGAMESMINKANSQSASLMSQYY
ncbi:flagellar filament capping protein FliD [Solibacillus isronensis]|uniref:flagellar filament capping protein FliD n=1 Tax=Solibacillus isronensis TaxID=412383 RepID=UPI0009A75C6F|nr:flagellar filament capping protein FliD [Solibacillus isronensis]